MLGWWACAYEIFIDTAEALHKDCINLDSSQHYMEVPVSPDSSKGMSSNFFIFANLIG